LKALSLKIPKIIIFLLLFLATGTSHAQVEDYDAQFFSKEHGLSSLIINDIYQDAEGYTWMGTTEGLNRFDGQQLKAYSKRKNGLTTNVVYKIFEDKNNLLWLISHITSPSISIFDKKTEVAMSFEEYFPNAPFQLKDIVAIDSEGNCIGIVTKQREVYQYEQHFKLLRKGKLLDDTFPKIKKMVWFNDTLLLGGSGYITVNEKDWNDTPLEAFMPDGYSRNCFITYEKIGERLYYFFKTGDEPLEYGAVNINTQSIIHKRKITSFDSTFFPSIKDFFFFSVKNEKVNRVWTGGKNYLKSSDDKGENEIDYTKKITQELKNFTVNKILEDNFQNIWIGTEQGLLLFTPKKSLFETFVSSEVDGEYRSIRGIEEYNNEQLFVASQFGLFLINKNTKDTTLIHASHDDLVYGLGTITLGDTILSGYYDYQFSVVDKKSNKAKVENYSYLIPTKTVTETKLFYQDKLNQVWIITLNGLFQLHLNTLKVSRPAHIKNNILSKTSTNYLFENKSGLWVATENGMLLMNHQGLILEEFEELKDFQISYIHQNKEGEFWLATKANGIIYWNRDTRFVRQFSKDDGLSDDFVNAIIEDEFGFFWLPTNNWFNPF